VTEFLIFLAMCGAFTLAFRWFLRQPNSEQRMKAHVAKEMAELRAKVAAEDAAQAQAKGFGRKAADRSATRFAPSASQYPLDSYGGVLEAPLGYDLANPDSRVIPDAFQGDWLWEDATENVSRHRISLRADSLIYIDAIGAEPVVGCYNIGPDEVAIVTQQMEDGHWLFATYQFKLLDGGTKLTNLESMDKRWNRLS
jgi:hypothetical protein